MGSTFTFNFTDCAVVNIGEHNTPLMPDQACRMLINLSNNSANLQFTNTPLDPLNALCYVVRILSSQINHNSDGCNWSSPESLNSIPTSFNMPIFRMENKRGRLQNFEVTRIRYFLSDKPDRFELVQYFVSAPNMQQEKFENKNIHSTQIPNTRKIYNENEMKPQFQQTNTKPNQLFGEEMDFVTSKDLALSRYKKHHDLLSEIFSPYKVKTIQTEEAKLRSSDNKDKFLKLKEKLLKELEEAKAQKEKQKLQFEDIRYISEKTKIVQSNSDNLDLLIKEMHNKFPLESFQKVHAIPVKELEGDLEEPNLLSL